MVRQKSSIVTSLTIFFDFAPTDMPTIGIVHDLDIWKKFCSEIKLKKFDR